MTPGSDPLDHRAAPSSPTVAGRRRPVDPVAGTPVTDSTFANGSFTGGVAVAAVDIESGADGYTSFDDADTPAEVDAVFRIQRRIALAHFFVFICVTLGVGLALVGLQWAGQSEVFGGFSPGFVMAGIGLYIFFVIVGAAAATLANSVEDRMMGARSLPPDPPR